jgi:hypothetical protein
MRHLTRVIGCTAVAVLALAACGRSTALDDAAPDPGSTSRPEIFPLTLERTGGIAGFQDVLVVAGNGLVSVTHKGQQQRHCQLTPEAVERLRTAASSTFG